MLCKGSGKRSPAVDLRCFPVSLNTNNLARYEPPYPITRANEKSQDKPLAWLRQFVARCIKKNRKTTTNRGAICALISRLFAVTPHAYRSCNSALLGHMEAVHVPYENTPRQQAAIGRQSCCNGAQCHPRYTVSLALHWTLRVTLSKNRKQGSLPTC